MQHNPDQVIDFTRNPKFRLTATRTLTADVKQWSPFDRKDHAMNVTRTLHFQWHGGPYIEVGFSLSKPVEVINVWDYAKGEPTIARTRRAFAAAIDSWIAEYDEDNPANSVKALMQDATNWNL